VSEAGWRRIEGELRARPRTWLVTGAAGFIGSHLCEALLGLEQDVRALDNLATGSRANLEDVRARAGRSASERLEFTHGDVCDLATCRAACQGVDLVLHQAALGSVPRSIEEPLTTHASNVTGFVNLLVAAKDAGCARVVYASSSSVYGDAPELPKREDALGKPLSPYAASKRVDEVYAEAFAQAYGLSPVGLRYFNVFGPRQDPGGAYAAVIPRWIATLLAGERPVINGDGETSRDFCPVRNVVQANLLAALAGPQVSARVFNVALGERLTLNQLFQVIRSELARLGVDCAGIEPRYGPERAGDIRHSLADLSRARAELRFDPDVGVAAGMAATVEWFVGRRVVEGQC
jgi:UDP-N-acetylglucosamine 4-epimerase